MSQDQEPTNAAAPFFIVMNTGSGRDKGEDLPFMIRSAMELAGRRFRLLVAEKPEDVGPMAQQAAAEARTQQGILVGAGGDGTLNTVAQAALESGCPFGLLPLGTFNYFGRSHGIPEDAGEAIQTLLHGLPRPVQVGMVNDRIFLVNGSIGLYPRLLRDREALKQRFGRSRLTAVWAGLLTLLRERGHLSLRLEHEGRERLVRTPSLFVGNDRLQLEQIGIPQAQAVEQGQLVAIVVKPGGTAALLSAALQGALGQLGEGAQVQSFAFRSLSVRPPMPFVRHHLQVATDGEVLALSTPLLFQVAPQPLSLIVPPGSTSGT